MAGPVAPPPDVEIPPPPDAPGALSRAATTLKGDVKDINREMGEVRESVGRFISKALTGGPGKPETLGTRFASSVLNPVPGSMGDAALMVVDPLIAVGPGGIARKAVGTAALHGTKEALEGRGPLDIAKGAAVGGAFGGVAGAARNLATGGSAARRLFATGNAIEEYASEPVVRAVAGWRQDPFRFTAENTLRRMQRGASAQIQTVWDAIAAEVPTHHRVALTSVPPSQRNAVYRHVQGREGEAGPVGAMIEGLEGGTAPAIPIEQAMRVRNRLKGDDNPLWHDVERDILNSLPDTLKDRYRGSLRQYARDQAVIDQVRGIQELRRLPTSGRNPTDFPMLVPTEGARTGGSGSPLYHFAAGLTHPTSPWGGLHLAEGTRRLVRRADPLITYTPPSRARRTLGTGGAAATSELGAFAQDAMDSPR